MSRSIYICLAPILLAWASAPAWAAKHSSKHRKSVKWAAEQGGCEVDEVQVEIVGDQDFWVRGCGDIDWLATTCTNGTPYCRSDLGVRKRATFDMSCGLDELEITVIDQDIRGVVGCNQKATYMYIPSSGYWKHSKWVLNSHVVTDDAGHNVGTKSTDAE